MYIMPAHKKGMIQKSRSRLVAWLFPLEGRRTLRLGVVWDRRLHSSFFCENRQSACPIEVLGVLEALIGYDSSGVARRVAASESPNPVSIFMACI